MAFYSERADGLPAAELDEIRRQVLVDPYMATNNLTADFVGTRGFSVVFRRDSLERVIHKWPCFGPYVRTWLDPDCNAFYLNPLLLSNGSRVNPHVDRSLRAYCRDVETPLLVRVLYVALPDAMEGGQLVLTHRRKEIGRITPALNKVVTFQGDLTHHVTPVVTAGAGQRLSLVCEQYRLEPQSLAQIPAFGIESQRKRY